jgi:UDP-glucose 4-epimerase
MMNFQSQCLVIGGCGFLGSYVAESLIRHGCFVRVFDRTNVDAKNIISFKDDLEMLYGDVSNQLEVDRSMTGIDNVFHFAGSANPNSSADHPIFGIESNVIGSLKVL